MEYKLFECQFEPNSLVSELVAAQSIEQIREHFDGGFQFGALQNVEEVSDIDVNEKYIMDEETDEFISVSNIVGIYGGGVVHVATINLSISDV
jgi:hypothetical protein